MRLLRPLLLRLLPRYASGALPPSVARWLARAMARDTHLAAAYDALRRAERLGSGTSVTGGQSDLLESLVFAAVDDARRDAAVPSRWIAWLQPVPLAMAAASLVLFVGLSGARDDTSSDGLGVGLLTARGEAIAKDAVGVKVSCLSADRSRLLASASAGARRRADAFTCPHGSLMAFSTTNLGAQARHVFVLGIAPDGDRRWYAPFGKDAGSVEVRAGAIDEVLPSLADTAPLPDEPVALFVLISDVPFAGSALERDLSLGERRLPLAKLQRLPVDVPLQARIDLLLP